MKSSLEIVSVINAEDAVVVDAVRRALPQIARAVGLIANALKRGGRLIYVGAGTSGRIAALDAAECPPTFNVDPRTVQFIMAGGPAALASAVEANEDSRELGQREMAKKRKPGRNDVIVGIAASGRTPFTIAAVEYARSKGAHTISVTCNRNTPLQRAAHLAIVTEVGPEVISGSTRMKAGTAQKMVLNMLSSGAMTRLGYVYGNLMVNVTPRNSKLAARGVSILQQAAGVSEEIARQALRAAGNSVPVGLVMLQAQVDRRGGRAGTEIGRRACAPGDHGGTQFVAPASGGSRPPRKPRRALHSRGRAPATTQPNHSPQAVSSGVTISRPLFPALAVTIDGRMDKFVIRGGNPLLGTIRVSGAKNAALPAMAAALLTEEPVILENIPQVRDIETTRKLLAAMGAEVELGYGRAQHRTTICARNLTSPEASYELVKQMRASSLVLGPLVARCGRARVSLPGGCAIGARPIDLHIKGLERLGAKITQDHGYVEASADRLKGGEILFDRITVTGTEDLLMAATLAEGETVMQNCAREPEVADLADLLNKMGAQIEGAGTSTIRVKGVSKLHGAKHRIIPDRIEAATFIIAGAMTGGDLNVAGCDPTHLGALLEKLAEVGVKTRHTADSVRVMGDVPIKAADIVTEEYPGFPTDMQAQYMALATQAEGTSIITENIFENRFMHALEMVRMGANIKIEGRRAVVRGPSPLSAAAVLASDLRASASLVLAALVAEGESIIDRVYHIDRGYENIEEKLKGVGAQIRRIGEILPKRAAAPARM